LKAIAPQRHRHPMAAQIASESDDMLKSRTLMVGKRYVRNLLKIASGIDRIMSIMKCQNQGK